MKIFNTILISSINDWEDLISFLTRLLQQYLYFRKYGTTMDWFKLYSSTPPTWHQPEVEWRRRGNMMEIYQKTQMIPSSKRKDKIFGLEYQSHKVWYIYRETRSHSSNCTRMWNWFSVVDDGSHFRVIRGIHLLIISTKKRDSMESIWCIRCAL